MKQSKINEIVKRLEEMGLSRAYRGDPPETIFYRFLEDKQCYIEVLTSFHDKENRRINNLAFRVAAEFADFKRNYQAFVMSPEAVSTKGAVDDIIRETVLLMEKAEVTIDSCEDVRIFLELKRQEEEAFLRDKKIFEQRAPGNLVKHRDYPTSFGVISEISGKNMKVRWVNGMGEDMPVERYARKSPLVLPFP
tara:strand:- start:204 stop:782 length:579 start_codon:yes stop_codon:yes gene_type:complete